MDNAHFIGIGGIGMSALARILKQRGANVTGSDQKQTPIIEALIAEGIPILSDHDSSTVIYSTAISSDHPEIKSAKEKGAQLLHRSELLQKLIEGQTLLGVAGTHGKTTTSSMLAYVLKKAGQNPSFALGGLVDELGGNGGHGSGKYFVAEADESDGSFLNLYPQSVILTSGDPDHLDYWKTASALEDAYKEFASRAKTLLWCFDDPHLQKLALSGHSYGFNPGADYPLKNFVQKSDRLTFDLNEERIEVRAIGIHNALNAAAVFALCLALGIEAKTICNALKTFPGVKRRAQILGKKQDILIIDDYAHHPIEIETTLKALKTAHPDRRLIALCQPHRYTRLSAHLHAFSTAFQSADLVFITDVFSAGENPIEGVSGQTLAKSASAKYVAKEAMLQTLSKHLRPHDLLVTLGAGDITHFGKDYLDSGSAKKLEIAVLCGGPSLEHEISVNSARAIIGHLDSTIYNVKPLYMSKSGQWSCLDGDVINISNELKNCDCVFPVFHGPFGEDGMIQGFLETLGIPFVGCDFRSSAVCMDKVWTKQILSCTDIKIAPFTDFFARDWKTDPGAVTQKIQKTVSYPLWIKAAHLGSSFGMIKVDHQDQLQPAIEKIIDMDTRFIIEAHTPGRELEVAVLGNEHLLITHPGEILLEGAFYDLEKKYNPNTPTTSCADLPDSIAQEAKKAAEKAFRACSCSGWARIDFLLDKDQNLYFSEINPIPGCTPTSLYPKMCEKSGIDYKTLLTTLIRLGLSNNTHRLTSPQNSLKQGSLLE